MNSGGASLSLALLWIAPWNCLGHQPNAGIHRRFPTSAKTFCVARIRRGGKGSNVRTVKRPGHPRSLRPGDYSLVQSAHAAPPEAGGNRPPWLSRWARRRRSRLNGRRHPVHGCAIRRVDLLFDVVEAARSLRRAIVVVPGVPERKPHSTICQRRPMRGTSTIKNQKPDLLRS